MQVVAAVAAQSPLPPPRHSDAHWARVLDEVRRALDEAPIYARRTNPPPPDTATAEAVSAWLARLPTVHKRDLRRSFPKGLVRRGVDLAAALAEGQVEIISTSGTSHDRLQILWEWAWWDPQERQAMRLNRRVAAAMRFDGFREAVLTTPVCGGATCHIGQRTRAERTVDGMLFLNQTADPTHWNDAEIARMAEEWNDFAPHGVEADPAYLATLCRQVQARGLTLRAPQYVACTYEQMLRAHRRDVARVLDCPLYSLYGASEAGVLFMECEKGHLHHNADHSHIELAPLDGAPGRATVIVTTLGRAWMPLVRYELGDVVRVADGACGCGLPENGYVLSRVEGRTSDMAFGRTAAEIDDLVTDADAQIAEWQLTIGDGSAPVLHVVGSDGRAAASALSSALGVKIAPAKEAALLPEGSGKYRRVRA